MEYLLEPILVHKILFIIISFRLFICINYNIFSTGDDGMKVIKNDNGICKPSLPSSAIAEEAVDQLQASEKLIAGVHCFLN